MSRLGLRVVATLSLLANLLAASAARAQGMMAPTPRPSRGGSDPKPSKEPQTHAASGASDESMHIGGVEPSLPAKPLAIAPEVRKEIGADATNERERGRTPFTYRRWIGPWYEEQSGSYQLKALFPLWFERRQPENDRASLFGGIYYNRRSPKHDADILFPLFWNLRDETNRTTVVGPVVRRTAPDAEDTWVAPLFFHGWRKDGGGYLHLIPPLVMTTHKADSGFDFALGYYCSWKGASSCSIKRSSDVDFGFAPLLFFAGKNERSRYELAAPLLHYYHYDEVEDSALNVWGPLVWSHSRESDAFNILPFFWHNWGKNEDHVTVFPLFHYGYKGNSSLLVNPLFLSARSEEGASTFATYLYARYRGRTTLDMVTPLYWRYTDPDIGLTQHFVPPIFYSSSSPRGNDLVVFPFFAHSVRPGLRETTWVTPLFSHSTDPTGWSTNIYPILYTGRTYQSTHLVAFPIYWDFGNPKSRTTIGFPLFWRFDEPETLSQLAGNVYYRKRKASGGSDWEVHVIPAFSYGETPDGHWWNVLFGLAGYTRRGIESEMRILYIPITLSDADSADNTAAR